MGALASKFPAAPGPQPDPMELLRRILIGERGVYRSQIVCSAPWADAIEGQGYRWIFRLLSPDFAGLSLILARDGHYPPRDTARRLIKQQVPMRCCIECGCFCPPSARQSVDLAGRWGPRCCDCVENTRPPSLLDELAKPDDGPAPQHEQLARICYVRRGIEEDGTQKLLRTELNNTAGRARAFVDEQQRIERRLARSESVEKLEAEIALYNAGEWEPEPEEDAPQPAKKKRRRH